MSILIGLQRIDFGDSQGRLFDIENPFNGQVELSDICQDIVTRDNRSTSNIMWLCVIFCVVNHEF